MCVSGLMVSYLEHKLGGPGSLSEGTGRNLLFNSDIKTFLLKIKGERQRA